MLVPGVVIRTERRKVKHSHVPISAIITARSRRYLREHIAAAAERGRIYYCDTDSVVCDAELSTCNLGKQADHSACTSEACKHLGGLKREYVIRRGRFVAPKLYALETSEGKQEIKAKGFSRSVGLLSPAEYSGLPSEGREREAVLRERIKREASQRADEGERVPLDFETFSKLSEGWAAVIERFLRLRELVKKDGINYTPRTLMMTKGINVDLRPKRKRLPDGDSEPWDVREIEDE